MVGLSKQTTRSGLVAATVRPAAHPRFYIRSTDGAAMVTVGRGRAVALGPARAFGLITDAEYRGLYLARYGRPPTEEGAVP